MSDFLIIDENKKKTDTPNTKVSHEEAETRKNFINIINDFLLGLQSIGVKEKVIFYRLLATMTNAGMTLVKAISVLEKQEKNLVLKKVLGRFCEDLKGGKKLSECMEFYDNNFSEAEIGMIKSGEKTGTLNKVLVDLADQIEKVSSISGKIKSAMIYPAIIFGVVIFVVSFMMTTIVPKLLEIFEDKSSLPASTQMLISISDMFRNYWFFMLMGLIICIIFIILWKKTPDGKYNFDKFLLWIPIFGGINKKLVLSKFSRVLAGLLSSGVSVVEGLKITSEAVGNEVYKQRIMLLASDVQQGIKIWESLDGDKLFPEMMIQMVQVGEQTAKLDHTIVKVAEFYDEQVDNTIRVLNKLLEPIIIVTMAIIIGFIAIAIMQPIMNLADTITSA